MYLVKCSAASPVHTATWANIECGGATHFYAAHDAMVLVQHHYDINMQLYLVRCGPLPRLKGVVGCGGNERAPGLWAMPSCARWHAGALHCPLPRCQWPLPQAPVCQISVLLECLLLWARAAFPFGGSGGGGTRVVVMRRSRGSFANGEHGRPFFVAGNTCHLSCASLCMTLPSS